VAKAKKHKVDVDRLCLAMQRDRWSLRRFRNERMRATRLYLGGHWSDEASWEKQPVNLLSLYVQIVGRQLTPQEPRVLLSTFDQQNKPMVHAMNAWANREMVHMEFAETLQRVVIDSLFSIGIMKIALASPADSALYSWNLQAGTPFAESIDLDDFVFDVHARKFSEVTYIGHRFRVPLDVVRELKIFNKQAREQVAPSSDNPYNLEGDERISALLRMPYAVDSQEYKDWVDLWEIYLPHERLVVTLHDDNLTGAAPIGSGLSMATALREQEWIGPNTGPYLILGQQIVPGNSMFKGPIQDLVDLHETVNRAYRKLDRQMGRLKEVLLVAGGAMEDGSRTQNANDGDIVRNDNPERARTVVFGGPAPALLQGAMHFQEQFMKMAGNLEMLGGLAPQSKTLGQDQLLAGNAAGGLASMQGKTIGFTSKAISNLCWYWWHHPQQVMRSKFPIPGMPDHEIIRHVTPQQRMQARWSDLDIEVDPYSFQHQTPQQRSQALTQLATGIIVPLMPMLQQQGVSFDLNAFLEKLAKYNDMPDLQEIVTFTAPPQADAQQAAPQAPGKPPQTSREYVRRSLGNDTPGGREQEVVEAMQNAHQQQPGMNGKAA